MSLKSILGMNGSQNKYLVQHHHTCFDSPFFPLFWMLLKLAICHHSARRGLSNSSMTVTKKLKIQIKNIRTNKLREVLSSIINTKIVRKKIKHLRACSVILNRTNSIS